MDSVLKRSNSLESFETNTSSAHNLKMLESRLQTNTTFMSNESMGESLNDLNVNEIKGLDIAHKGTRG